VAAAVGNGRPVALGLPELSELAGLPLHSRETHARFFSSRFGFFLPSPIESRVVAQNALPRRLLPRTNRGCEEDLFT
jgi:hypothetical protein